MNLMLNKVPVHYVCEMSLMDDNDLCVVTL